MLFNLLLGHLAEYQIEIIYNVICQVVDFYVEYIKCPNIYQKFYFSYISLSYQIRNIIQCKFVFLNYLNKKIIVSHCDERYEIGKPKTTTPEKATHVVVPFVDQPHNSPIQFHLNYISQMLIVKKTDM